MVCTGNFTVLYLTFKQQLLFIISHYFFLQVSDLHLSLFQDKDRGTELLEFCDYTMNHIQPSVILATGKLVYHKIE